MKPRLIALAVAAILGPGCATHEKPRAALDVEPVLSVRHGVPEAQAQYQLGRYYQGQYRYEQAELAYMRALALDSRHVEAMNALATLYAAQGNLQGSAQMLERVVAMAPDAAHLYNNLGFAYFLQGRFEDAFGAVRKALRLDPTLQRAWANLDRIVDLTPGGTTIASAVKARRLEDIPLQLAAADAAAPAASASHPGTRSVGSEKPAEDQPALTAEIEAARNGVDGVPAAADSYTLVTAAEQVVADGRTVDLRRAADPATVGEGRSVAPRPGDRAARPAPPPAAFRLEVSNGNGVPGFARRFSEHLRSQEIAVARVTNNRSFTIPQSLIEFQPGHESAAQSLLSSTGLPARLVGTANARLRTEVRLVLGHDALPHLEHASSAAVFEQAKPIPLRRG
jgi:hypothetical protein